MENKRLKQAAPFLVAAASVLWGVLFVFVRKLSEGGFSAMDIVCIRAYGSVFFLFPMLFLMNRRAMRIKLRDCWCFVGTGVFSIVFFSFCFFRNVELSSAAFASILMYTSPVWVTIFSAIFFQEKWNRQKAVALLMALLGCILVSGVLNGISISGSVGVAFTNGIAIGRVSPLGLMLGLGSGIGYGLYSVFGRFALDKGYAPMAVTAYTFLFACVGVLPFVNVHAIIRRFTDNPGLLIWALCISFFSTAMAFLLYTSGLGAMEAGRAAVLATLEPIITAIVGTLLYKEALSVTMGIGIVLVLVSSIIISRNR